MNNQTKQKQKTKKTKTKTKQKNTFYLRLKISNVKATISKIISKYFIKNVKSYKTHSFIFFHLI